MSLNEAIMNLSAEIPGIPGTYLLFVRLDTPLKLPVGRLGTFELPAGHYAYVGSAHGPGGLHARIARHQRPEKQLHWHIDALTVQGTVESVWFDTSAKRLECRWASTLATMPDITAPIPGFGASDCPCSTHLFAVPDGTLTTLWDKLGRPAAKPALP
jgi:Uri superfamily endonuclease